MWTSSSDRERAAANAAIKRQRKASIPTTGNRVLTLRIVYNPGQMERDSEFVQDRRADSLDSYADIIKGDISALLESDDIDAVITVVFDLPAEG